MVQRFGKGLVLAGFAVFMFAVVWWYLFYAQLLDQDVKRASECFYTTTQDCAVGNLVVTVMGDIAVYDPQVLWLAAGLAIAGIVLLVSGSAGDKH